jgi:hypothetical protein
MTAVVNIKHGFYCKTPIKNQTFKVVKDYNLGKKGNYITVMNEGQVDVDRPVIKIRVDNRNSFEYVSHSVTAETDESTARMQADYDAQPVESDVEAMNRISTRFEILDQMAAATMRGDIRAVIVTGPPGVGKSHGVIQQMEKDSLFDKISNNRPRYEVVKGAISGIGLFALLYKFSDARNVLIFDDCDLWEDQDALNVLKGALDSNKKRRISWNKDSRLLRDEGVPNSFDFCGSVIFITNLNLSDRRSKKIQAHIEALQSRCHYLDLTINDTRDKLLRIKQVHRDSGLFNDYNLSKEQEQDILSFMEEKAGNLREISLRMAL